MSRLLGRVRYVFLERLTVEEKINFARHLAMVIRAGLPIFQGLTILQNQASSKTMKRILKQLIVDVNNGHFLADSLEQFKPLFGDFFINIVRVGEASGTLNKNLMYLAGELKKNKELQSKVRGAMIYPMVILAATVGITGFLTFYVFPKLLPVFSGLNVQLPTSTRALIAAVAFLQTYGVFVLVGAIGVYVAFHFFVRRIKWVQYFLDRSVLYSPVVGQLSVAINVVNFTRVLSLLLKSGIKIVEALNITANTFSNSVYKKAMGEAAEEIKRGGQLATSLVDHPRFFPPILVGMVRVGEDTGNLEENLQYLSEYYDDELENSLHDMTVLLEPLLLLLMGAMVGFVAISIITPIYSVSQGVK